MLHLISQNLWTTLSEDLLYILKPWWGHIQAAYLALRCLLALPILCQQRPRQATHKLFSAAAKMTSQNSGTWSHSGLPGQALCIITQNWNQPKSPATGGGPNLSALLHNRISCRCKKECVYQQRMLVTVLLWSHLLPRPRPEYHGHAAVNWAKVNLANWSHLLPER